MPVGQVVHQVRPGCSHQDTEAEQHAEGDQPVSDGDALAYSLAHRGPRTHKSSQPLRFCGWRDIVPPSQHCSLGLIAAAEHHDLLQLIARGHSVASRIDRSLHRLTPRRQAPCESRKPQASDGHEWVDADDAPERAHAWNVCIKAGRPHRTEVRYVARSVSGQASQDAITPYVDVITRMNSACASEKPRSGRATPGSC
jgi:hypothetical protein